MANLSRWQSLALRMVPVVIVAVMLGNWLSDLSDATWWQTLPWILIGLFWGFLGYQMWQRRKKAAE